MINRKAMLFFLAIAGALVLVLTALGLYTFRQFSLYAAERHAASVAETIKVGLTESMVNGTIDKRGQFLERLTQVPGVRSVRIIRGAAVVRQFGPGMSREGGSDPRVDEVMASGKASFELSDNIESPVFRAIIPYTATALSLPNCLQCHQVSLGTVLGAVAIEVPLAEMQHQAIVAAVLVSLAVVAAFAVAALLLRRHLRPLVATAEAVKDVTNQALVGNFSGRVAQQSADEVGEIAANMNRLMQFLEKELGIIASRVGQLVGQNPSATGNRLVATTEMVVGLVEASQFKQAIEEDQNKTEIYRRIAAVLSGSYDFSRFSIYEVAASKNRIIPMIVDGEVDAPCRWCDPEILVDASACRAQRTGHIVNAVEFPGLCTKFRDDGDERQTHICLPIVQSGIVGCVVQLVAPAEHGQLLRMLVPFIAVYLREAAPVLEAKRLMEHLRESSLRDAMTGLYNRRFLEEYVTTLVATSQRRKSPFTVLMLDLDHFKQVNDTHGHEAGDKVLKVLADILAKSVRSSDLVVRYGGEEFLVVLLDSGSDDAGKVAEKIRARVAETKIPLPGAVLQKTISIGLAEFPQDADNFWQVVKFADVALYEAKTGGRNRVVRFLPNMWKDPDNY